jgi:hypothetical protein
MKIAILGAGIIGKVLIILDIFFFSFHISTELYNLKNHFCSLASIFHLN